MVDFIPFGTSYSDLLAQIRGGSLESVQMYGPVGHATSFVTARIVFTDETGATGLYQVSGLLQSNLPESLRVYFREAKIQASRSTVAQCVSGRSLSLPTPKIRSLKRQSMSMVTLAFLSLMHRSMTLIRPSNENFETKLKQVSSLTLVDLTMVYQ